MATAQQTGPTGPGLEKNASSSSTRRSLRFARRSGLWKMSQKARCRSCGRKRVAALVGVGIRDGHARFSGLETCANVWVCPVCSGRILARRHDEVRSAINAWLEGHETRRVAMLTLTLRHDRTHKLADLWNALSPAWGRVTSGRAWVGEKERHGLGGWLRVVEVLDGRNGWHLHIHVLLFLEAAPSRRAVQGWKSAIFERWARAVTKAGLPSPRLLAQDLKLIEGKADPLSAYFTKHGEIVEAMSHEVTSSALKSSRIAKGRTPWALLDQALEGDRSARRRWWEYERATHGRRQMTWSRGFRRSLGLEDEATDGELAEETNPEERQLCQFGIVYDATARLAPEVLLAFGASPGDTHCGTSQKAGGKSGRDHPVEHCAHGGSRGHHVRGPSIE